MEWLLHVDMDQPITVWDVGLRITLATLFGGMVGFDREAQGKAAGLRTHMLVSLGSAVFTLAALEMYQLTTESGKGDPTRIVEGIVQGIGFLGAGQIIQGRGTVQGVTTAAGIWVVGAIGIACGGGYYLLAGMTVLMVLVILRAAGVVERRFARA